MLTLLLAGCSIASPSAEQTSSAATTQGSAAPESDSDARPSLITSDADAMITSGGDYVFWSTQDKTSYYIYGYNVVTQKQFWIGGPADRLGSFASDGKTVAWLESVPLSDGSYNMAIRSYDLTTKAHTSIRVMDEYSQGSISVDQGVLYYSDETSGHTGIYAFNLSTRQEKMINVDYHDNIVEADGVMV